MGQITTSDKKGFILPYNNLNEELKNSTKPKDIGTFAPDAPKKPTTNTSFGELKKIVGSSDIQAPSTITPKIMRSFSTAALGRMAAEEVALLARKAEKLTDEDRTKFAKILHSIKPLKFPKPTEYYLVLDDNAKEGNAIEENRASSEINTKDTLLDGSKVIEQIQKNVTRDKDRIRKLLNRKVSPLEVGQLTETKEVEPEGTKKSNVLRSTKLGKTYQNKIKTAEPQQEVVTPSVTEEVPLVTQVESSVEKTEKIETAQTIPNEIPEVTPSAETQTPEIVNETVTNTEENEVQENTPEEKPTQVQEEVIPVEIITPTEIQEGEAENSIKENPFTRRAASELAPDTLLIKSKQESVNSLLKTFAGRAGNNWMAYITAIKQSSSKLMDTESLNIPKTLETIAVPDWRKKLEGNTAAQQVLNDLVTI